MKKIKVNNKIIELSDSCRWSIKDNVLWNENTGRREGVEGDLVTYQIGGVMYQGHVVGYTCHQLIETKDFGPVVLSANECCPSFVHRSKVEAVDEAQPNYKEE